MSIKNITDREIELTKERDTLRQQLSEAQAQIEASRKQEPYAKVDADDDGWWADILSDRNVKIGQLLYANPVVAPDDQSKLYARLGEAWETHNLALGGAND